MRRILFGLIDSHWKLALLSAGAIGAHVFWIDTTGTAEHAQRLGYTLSLLGTVAAARGFLRLGSKAEVVQRVAAEPDELDPELARTAEALKDDTEEAQEDVRVERIWGVGLLLVGQALAGYGDLLAHRLWLGD